MGVLLLDPLLLLPALLPKGTELVRRALSFCKGLPALVDCGFCEAGGLVVVGVAVVL